MIRYLNANSSQLGIECLRHDLDSPITRLSGTLAGSNGGRPSARRLVWICICAICLSLPRAGPCVQTDKPKRISMMLATVLRRRLDNATKALSRGLGGSRLACFRSRRPIGPGCQNHGACYGRQPKRRFPGGAVR
jgi:hypothetical protein